MLLEITRVENDEQHEAALDRLREILPRQDEDARDEAKIIALLIDAYETTRWPIETNLDPVDIILGAIEHAGHDREDLVRMIGRPRTSEILNRKRPLTLDMIRTISAAWGIPLELLTPAYELDKAR